MKGLMTQEELHVINNEIERRNLCHILDKLIIKSDSHFRNEYLNLLAYSSLLLTVDTEEQILAFWYILLRMRTFYSIDAPQIDKFHRRLAHLDRFVDHSVLG